MAGRNSDQGLRGPRLLVQLTLSPGETADLLVESDTSPAAPVGPINNMNDQLHDIAGDSRDVRLSRLKTDHVTIEWSPGQGITSWKDASGRELIDLSEPLRAALDALRNAAREAAASPDDLRLWRMWARQLATTFETADRVH